MFGWVVGLESSGLSGTKFDLIAETVFLVILGKRKNTSQLRL